MLCFIKWWQCYGQKEVPSRLSQDAPLNNQAIPQDQYERKFIWNLEGGAQGRERGAVKSRKREEERREEEGKRQPGDTWKEESRWGERGERRKERGEEREGERAVLYGSQAPTWLLLRTDG